MTQHIKAHITTKAEPKARVRGGVEQPRARKSRALGALTSLAAVGGGNADPMAQLLAMLSGGGIGGDGRRASDTLVDEAGSPSDFGISDPKQQETLHEALAVLQYLGERYDWNADKIEVIAAICADSATARRLEVALQNGQNFDTDARNALIEKLRHDSDLRMDPSGQKSIPWVGSLQFAASDIEKDLTVRESNGPEYDAMQLRGIRVLNRYVGASLGMNGALWATLRGYEVAVQKKLESMGYTPESFEKHGEAAVRVGEQFAQELITGVPVTPWDADTVDATATELPPVLRGSGVGGPGVGEGFGEEDEEAIEAAAGGS